MFGIIVSQNSLPDNIWFGENVFYRTKTEKCTEAIMDRRQRKTREAIFNAFTELLSKKHYSQITVGEIIEKADVGRATFYAHFETKDYLLKELCGELFDHIFSTEQDHPTPYNLFQCNGQDNIFLHLFKHIQRNDNNIGKLLSSKNNELFLEYFSINVEHFAFTTCI